MYQYLTIFWGFLKTVTIHSSWICFDKNIFNSIQNLYITYIILHYEEKKNVFNHAKNKGVHWGMYIKHREVKQ